MVTIDEKEEALTSILNKTYEAAYETFGLSDGLLTTMPAVSSMRNLTSSPSRHYEFSFGLNIRMLLELFGDAHTRVEVMAADNYFGLDVSCLSWLFDGEPSLVSTCCIDCGEVDTCREAIVNNTSWFYYLFPFGNRPGDLVITMGGLSPAGIVAELQSEVLHENDYFLRNSPG